MDTVSRGQNICGPNSIIRVMLDGEFDNYWSKTVAFSSLKAYITMNFDGLKDAVIALLGDNRVKVSVEGYENDMTSFQDKDDILTVLIHLGYLAYDTKTSEVYIPNLEVRQIFEKTMKSTGWTEVVNATEKSERLLNATLAGDEEEVASEIDECHMMNTSSIKYNDENSLASCITLAYYYARNEYTMIREMPAGYGFADMVFVPKTGTDKPAIIVELKWNRKSETAMKQIEEKKYIHALEGYSGEVVLVGVNYDKKTKKA